MNEGGGRGGGGWEAEQFCILSRLFESAARASASNSSLPKLWVSFNMPQIENFGNATTTELQLHDKVILGREKLGS